MPALTIACSGATYYGSSVLDIMRHRCKETQPRNEAVESSEEEVGDEVEEVVEDNAGNDENAAEADEE
ncbi:uncharacterized protein TEOVI_000505000 [Trypanosoma equiperdum]|uniref:Uncharacterized protein n=2 Tax=Trypanozoon TaxID=39700 RepID=A0A1G4I711_TRYEQ|nr:hypothetical protein DPX39_110142200 [Trypanosoma brucei equiperdum]SCU67697.1 hypothetical protein, conserved [Trypanosoma equiperdum]